MPFQDMGVRVWGSNGQETKRRNIIEHVCVHLCVCALVCMCAHKVGMDVHVVQAVSDLCVNVFACGMHACAQRLFSNPIVDISHSL
jgi:hypothetical protein